MMMRGGLSDSSTYSEWTAMENSGRQDHTFNLTTGTPLPKTVYPKPHTSEAQSQ